MSPRTSVAKIHLAQNQSKFNVVSGLLFKVQVLSFSSFHYDKWVLAGDKMMKGQK